MNKQELIERMEGLKNIFGNKCEYVKIDFVIELASELDEPQKPVVPQFVANWIEYFKNCSGTLYGSTAPYSYYGRAITDDFEGDVTKALEWIRNNSEAYARAWLDGYEVEKEKRYLVKIIGITNYNSYLNYHKREDKWTIESRAETDAIRTEHTRKQLEEADFGWVFDCEGIEIEEVEG